MGKGIKFRFNHPVKKPDDNFYVGLDCNILAMIEARHFAEDIAGCRLSHRGEFHITVISPPELKSLKRDHPELLTQEFDIPKDGLSVLGLGAVSKGDRRAYYLIVDWPEAQEFRAKYGLKPYDFHITLGYLNGDVFGVRKDWLTLVTEMWACPYCGIFLKEDFDQVVNHLQCHLDEAIDREW